MSLRSLTLVVAALVTACEAPAPQAPGPRVERAARALTELGAFGSNPGRLKMYFQTPTDLGAGRPLVVLLHGCGDTAADFAAAWSEWAELSARHGFALLYPEQQPENNLGNVSCFNWFEAENQRRGEGENLSVRQMVEAMERRFGTDRRRTYAVGFSAGGAAAVNLLATQPDVFSAGVSVAGLPFACASSLFGAEACIEGRVDRSAAEWARAVLEAAPGLAGPRPRLAVWQGLADGTVAPGNRRELVEQWTAVHGLEPTAVTSGPSGVADDTRSTYPDAAGAVRVELHALEGVGHTLRPGWAPAMAEFLALTREPSPFDAGVRADTGREDTGATEQDAGAGAADAGAGGTLERDAGGPAPAIADVASGCGATRAGRAGDGLLPLAAVLLGRRRRRGR